MDYLNTITFVFYWHELKKKSKMLLEEEKDELDFMSPLVELVIGVVVILIFGLLGTAAAYGYAQWASGGLSLQEVMMNLGNDNTLMNRNIVRYSNLFVHLFTFIMSSIVIARFVSRKGWVKYLKLDRTFSMQFVVASIFLILVSGPFVALTYWINMQIPLPNWATTMEADTNAMLEAMLTMNSPTELLSNLLIMAVIPAIGEELLFRGIILQFFEKYLKKENLAVLLTAIIFSAIHLQFEGFIPRFLLGAILGYLFIWSRSIWIPIITHFFFNGVQVLGKYAFNIELENQETMTPNWLMGIASLALCIFIIRFLIKKRTD